MRFRPWIGATLLLTAMGCPKEPGGARGDRGTGIERRGDPSVCIDQTYGGGLDENARSIRWMPDRGFILAGSAKQPKATADGDGMLVRADGAGRLVWTRTFGGDDLDELFSAIPIPDGGYAAVGSTWSKGAGVSDAWLAVVDEQGQLLWDRTYGGENTDVAKAVVSIPGGGFAIAGTTSSSSAGKGDFWLVRIDASGKMLWDRTMGGKAQDTAHALVRMPDGGFAIAGQTESKGAGGSEAWLVRVDANGRMLWDQTYGGGGYDKIEAMAVMPDEGFALAGTRTTSKGLVGWLVRTDDGGKLLWEETYVTRDFQEFRAVAPLADGGFVMAGVQGQNENPENAWMVRTDASGKKLWGRLYKGAYWQWANGVAALQDGTIVMAGTRAGRTGGSLENADFWLLRTDPQGFAPCLASEEEE